MTTYYSLDGGGSWNTAETLGVGDMNGYKNTWGNRSYSLPGGANNNSAIGWKFECWASSGSTIDLDNVVVSGIPEPATMVLMALGLLGLCRRRVS